MFWWLIFSIILESPLYVTMEEFSEVVLCGAITVLPLLWQPQCDPWCLLWQTVIPIVHPCSGRLCSGHPCSGCLCSGHPCSCTYFPSLIFFLYVHQPSYNRPCLCFLSFYWAAFFSVFTFLVSRHCLKHSHRTFSLAPHYQHLDDHDLVMKSTLNLTVQNVKI